MRCSECGMSIDPDHEPRTASGRMFHRTPSHCVSALLDAFQWIADNTGRDTWLDQFERRFVRGDVADLLNAIDAARADRGTISCGEGNADE